MSHMVNQRKSKTPLKMDTVPLFGRIGVKNPDIQRWNSPGGKPTDLQGNRSSVTATPDWSRRQRGIDPAGL